MKKGLALLLCAALCLVCGCERSPRTDVVLFCSAFNEQMQGVTVREENVFRRSDTELLLYADNLLLRLLTTQDNTIHTVVVTGCPAQIQALREAARCAFSILAEPFGETAPTSLLRKTRAGEIAVEKEETEHFLYLLYRSPDSVTILQWNRLLCPIPSLPSLHPAGAE